MKYLITPLAMLLAISVNSSAAVADSDSRDKSRTKYESRDNRSDDRSDDRSKDAKSKAYRHADKHQAKSRNATMERMLKAKEMRERPTSR